MDMSILELETRIQSPKRRPWFGRGSLVGYAYVAPFLLIFFVFQLIPVAFAIWQSLHGVTRSGLGIGAATTRFVGLANYVQAIHDQDFIAGVLRVLLFGIVQVPVMLGMALVLALLFDSSVAMFKTFFQFAAFLPYALPGIVASILWSFLYLPGVSPVVAFLQGLNLPHDFLGPGTVLWSIANIVTWQWTGYNMLIIFSALQALPHDIFEAARVDGANGWMVNTRIKIPLVLPSIILTAVFSIIGTLQLFSEPTIIRTLTNNVTSKFTPNMAAYNIAFGGNNPNYAAAVAVTLAVITFILSFGFMKLTQGGVDQ
ncbi:MAG: sugar ABC transporter permease [Herpetosiphon sp.]